MYVPSHTTDKKSFNAKLKILKIEKNLAGARPRSPEGARGEARVICMYLLILRTKNSFNATLKIFKNRKNSGRGPGAPKNQRGERGSQNFFDFLKFSTLH